TLYMRPKSRGAYDIVDEFGARRAPLSIYERAPLGGGPSDAHVSWIGGYGPSVGQGGTNAIGPRDIRSLARAVAAEVPKAETISGYRVSGARSAPGSRGPADAKMRLPRLTEEQRQAYFQEKEQLPETWIPSARPDAQGRYPHSIYRSNAPLSPAQALRNYIADFQEGRRQGHYQGGGLVQPQSGGDDHPDDHAVLIDVTPKEDEPAHISAMERMADIQRRRLNVPTRQMGGLAPGMPGAPPPQSMQPSYPPSPADGPLRGRQNQWP